MSSETAKGEAAGRVVEFLETQSKRVRFREIVESTGLSDKQARNAIRNALDRQLIRRETEGTANYYSAGEDPKAVLFHQVMVGMSRIRATA